MEHRLDYFSKKAVDWVFRKKTILYFFVMALFREFTAIGASDTLTAWTIDPNLQDKYIHYPLMALNFLFEGGDWTVIWILVSLIIFFKISELIETYLIQPKEAEKKSNSEQSKQIISNNAPIGKQVNINAPIEKLNI